MATATKRRGPDAANVEAPGKNKDANLYSNSINDLYGFALVGGSGKNRKAPAVKAWRSADLLPVTAGTWLGVDCDRNRLTVIDLDGVEGRASFKAFLIEHTGSSKLPSTALAKTPRGWHIYFRAVPGVTNSVGWLRSVDVRSAGGYVVSPQAPGYVIIKSGPIAEAPSWLVGLMPTRRNVTTPTPTAFTPNPTAHSADGLVHVVRNAREGERNATLHWAACRAYEMARPAKVRRTVNHLADAARESGLPDWEIDRAIHNACRAVMTK